MGHGTIHKRGRYQPDIELHLRILDQWPVWTGGKTIYRILVEDDTGRRGELDEPWIDYQDTPTIGIKTVFYVPRKMAKEAGFI